MTARVHDTWILGLIGNVRRLRDGQRIHVGTQRHHFLFRAFALDLCDKTGCSYTFYRLYAERAELSGDVACGVVFLIRQLRVCMEVASHRDDLAGVFEREVFDFIKEVQGQKNCSVRAIYYRLPVGLDLDPRWRYDGIRKEPFHREVILLCFEPIEVGTGTYAEVRLSVFDLRLKVRYFCG